MKIKEVCKKTGLSQSTVRYTVLKQNVKTFHNDGAMDIDYKEFLQARAKVKLGRNIKSKKVGFITSYTKI